MCLARRTDNYQELLLKSLLQEVCGHMATKTINKEQIRIPPGFSGISCVRRLPKSGAADLVRGFSTRRAGEETVLFFWLKEGSKSLSQESCMLPASDWYISRGTKAIPSAEMVATIISQSLKPS